MDGSPEDTPSLLPHLGPVEPHRDPTRPDAVRALVAEAELLWQHAIVAVVHAYLAGTPLTDERRAGAEQLAGSLRTELRRLIGRAYAAGAADARREGPTIARETHALRVETNEVRALFAPGRR